MKVSLFRRAGESVWQMQARDPENPARKIRKSAGTAKRRDAERAAARWELELVERGLLSSGESISWEEFRRRYEDGPLTGLAESTAHKVAAVFNTLQAILRPKLLSDVVVQVVDLPQKLRSRGRSESTIKSHLAHIRAALAWGVDRGYLREVPKLPKIQRAKSSNVMKGRPITGEEFERMLAAAAKVIRKPNRGRARLESDPDEARIASWQEFLKGLWWSGLRIGEALSLHWTDHAKIRPDLTGARPMLEIPADQEKGHRDRLLPVAPEFARMLTATPESQRAGYVFNPLPLVPGRRLGVQQATRIVAAIGRAAGVVVKPGKHATAHDLRRSFGERWASRVMPAILKELMRHGDIGTTMKFYVGANATRTAEQLWVALESEATDAADGCVFGCVPAENDEK